jgi:hypothetical protein
MAGRTAKKCGALQVFAQDIVGVATIFISVIPNVRAGAALQFPIRGH